MANVINLRDGSLYQPSEDGQPSDEQADEELSVGGVMDKYRDEFAGVIVMGYLKDGTFMLDASQTMRDGKSALAAVELAKAIIVDDLIANSVGPLPAPDDED